MKRRSLLKSLVVLDLIAICALGVAESMLPSGCEMLRGNNFAAHCLREWQNPPEPRSLDADDLKRTSEGGFDPSAVVKTGQRQEEWSRYGSDLRFRAEVFNTIAKLEMARADRATNLLCVAFALLLVNGIPVIFFVAAAANGRTRSTSEEPTKPPG